MKTLTLKLAAFFLLFSNAFAQDNGIAISAVQSEGKYVIKGTNNSSERKEVTLTLLAEGYSGSKSPIVKLINKGESIEFATLTPIAGKNQKLSYGHVAKSKPTDEELAVKTAKLKNHIGVNADDFSKGIYIFTKDGCPRCEKTLNYLLEKDLNFKYFNTTATQANSMLMWEKIKEKKASEKVTMPVVLVNGKLTHSHPDLGAFLKTLK